MNSGGALTLGIIILLAGYFLPSIIALSRGHKDAAAIVAVNLFLGWSVIGWFFSFIWSLSNAKRQNTSQTVVINTAQHNFAAPQQPQIAAASPQQHQTVDQDTAFWDALANKSDPDSLDEYLVRFPDGRFAQLARNRLARSGGITPPVIVQQPAPQAPDPPSCPSCLSEWESGSRFCSACGASAPTAQPA